MITRLWHGRTSLKHASSYLEFLLNAGTREYKETPGNISIKIWKKEDKDCCHFYTVTEWENLDAVKRFAGEDFEEAVYYPEDQGILLEFEEKVTHFETYTIPK
jgi:heme-degrading monooxygenase HmoA